jgi:hypothetical protein
MFEKLLLAATVTFSLSLFISIGAQSSKQGVLANPASNNFLEMAKIQQNHSLFSNQFE